MATTDLEQTPVYPVAGVRLATVQAGIRYRERRDLVVIELAENSRTAAVFTRNAFCAAPVVVAREHLAHSAGDTRYLLINAGNANAGTGERGRQDALRSCETLAGSADVPVAAVLPFSTGVIGEHLPMDRLLAGIGAALPRLAADGWQEAARGIMTTDTRPKLRSRQVETATGTVTLTGFCKGAGMIRPDMATMLAYLFTDAAVSQKDLQQLLRSATEQSFNRITVDGDTSTNDACTLSATGQSAVALSAGDGEDWQAFSKAVHELMQELAISIIHDAEGARKFVTVDVTGGGNSEECLRVAYAIAESPLVKTALTASDPNWGRILAAVGRAGIRELDVGRVRIWLDDVPIVSGGMVDEHYREAAGQAVMQQESIRITVDLARGEVAERVWTSDLSEEYVRINASYRS
ncbi:MAG: bifunctional glutamate N-acetyltransferase/amino-acid acetyltransferase ArgJ [Pseudohongiellaceae bacterium]